MWPPTNVSKDLLFVRALPSDFASDKTAGDLYLWLDQFLRELESNANITSRLGKII